MCWPVLVIGLGCGEKTTTKSGLRGKNNTKERCLHTGSVWKRCTLHLARRFPGQVLPAADGWPLAHDPWNTHTPRSLYSLHLINVANLWSTVAFLCCKRFQEMLSPHGKLAFLLWWSTRIHLHYFQNLKTRRWHQSPISPFEHLNFRSSCF